MIKEVTDDKVRLIHGDCSGVVAGLPDRSVDMVLTDPPYGISYQSNGRVKSKKFAVLANDDNDSRLALYPELHRVLKADSVAAVFCSFKNYQTDYEALKDLFHIKNVIIWHKGGGGLGDLKHTLATDYEMIIIAHKGRCKIRGKREGSVWHHKKVPPSKMVHATEKLVDLIERLAAKYSDEGGIILDPFMGSGTTGVAARNLNRSFIGVELDDTYFDVAKGRISPEVPPSSSSHFERRFNEGVK